MKALFRKQSGISMAIALLTLLVITVIAFALGAIGIRNMNESSGQNFDDLALRTAQAGVQYTVYKLNNILNTCPSCQSSSDCSTWIPYGPGPWPGYGTQIPSLTQNYTNTYPTQSMTTVNGNFSTTYYSNLLDSCGYPTSSSIPWIGSPVGSVTVPASSIAVVSTGTFNAGIVSGGIKRKVLSILKWKNPYNYAFGAVNQISVSGHLTTDSYNSDLGSYDSPYSPQCGGPPCGYDGNVGTNSSANPAMTIGGSATIYGAAVVGLGGSVAGASSTNPSNGWVQCNNCVDTTLATLPTLPNNPGPAPGYTFSGPGPAYDVTDNSPSGCSQPLPPNYNYQNLNVSGSVYLAPGRYVFNSVKVGGTLYACVNSSYPNAPVVIYLSNNTSATLPQCPSGSAAQLALCGTIEVIDGTNNDLQKAENLLIYGNGNFTGIDLKSGPYKYTMFLHAPKAVVNNHGAGNVNVYGSMVVDNSGVLRGNLNLHADEALRRVIGGQPSLLATYYINY